MFDGLDDAQTLHAARRLFEETLDIWTRFFKKMTEDFKFHSGGEEQWDSEDLRVLREQKRPVVTYNLVKVIIRELIGAQEDAKREAKVVPVGREDQARAEVLNRLWRAVRRQTDADFAEAEAFEKGAIGGIAYVAVDLNPKPGRPDWVEFVIQPINPLEVMPDTASQRRDMRDAQLIIWNRWLRDAQFIQRHPDQAERVKELWRGMREEGMGLHEVATNSQETPPGPTSPIDLPAYAADGLYLDRRRRMIRVVHLEYRCPKRAYYAVNPDSGRPERISKERFALRKVIPEIEFASVWEDEVYWLEFIGDEILYHEPSPANRHCFSIEAFVADRDHLTGEPVGIVRDLKDPQREINKRSSTNLNHLTLQGAPGYFAETGAVVDQSQFERSLKDGSTAWLNAGGVAKILPRQPPSPSPAAAELVDRATQMFSRVGGVDVDSLIAQRSADEPATTALLRYRKSLLAVTKTLQNYHAFQSRILRNVLYLLKMVPDSQLEAMLGDRKRWRVQQGIVVDLKSGLQIPVAELAEDEWDIEMDVAAANTTIALLVLQILIQMSQVGVPIDPSVMVESLPIAQDKKNQMLEFIEATQAAAAQDSKVQQDELKKRLDLDAAIEQFKAKLELAGTAESMRHNRELEMANVLKGQRDFLVDLLSIAKDVRSGAGEMLTGALQALVQATEKYIPDPAATVPQPRAAPQPRPMTAPAVGGIPGLA